MAAPAKLTVQQLIERNKALTKTHQPLPLLEELMMAAPDAPHYVVITCADPRCVPESFLATTPADGLVTFRNVGGHITPQVITDILALDGFMGITGILVVHHTDCGTTHFKDAAIREGLKARVPSRAAEIEGMGFGAIEDLPQSVRDDIAKLRSSPLVREELKGEVYGFVYDIKTGALGAVEA